MPLDVARVLVWNAAAPGRDPGDVASLVAHLMDKHDCHAAALQEVKRCGPAFRRELSRDYLVHQLSADAWDEADQTAVIVRRDVLPIGSRPAVGHLRTTAPWRGPKHGLPHNGRTLTWADFGGPAAFRLVSVHRTNPRWGLRAAREEQAALAALALRPRSRRRTFLAPGDHNCDPFPPADPWTSGALVDRDKGLGLGLRAEPARHIDWALVDEDAATRTRVLSNFGSDHPAWILTADRRGHTLTGI